MSEVKLHLQDVPLQTSDNEDDFSDIEQNINDTSFQLQPNKNQTATSNFKSNFTVLNQHQLNPSSSIKSLSAKQEHKPKSFKDNKSQPYPQLHLQEQQPKSFENIDISSGNSDLENEASSSQIPIQQNNTEHNTHNNNIYEYYQTLREQFRKTGIQYEDPDFVCNADIFCTEKENPEGEFEIEFERPPFDEDNLEFFDVEQHSTVTYNIEHEFKITRGILNDKFFIGALLMLFKKKEEFFTNLVIDYEHIKENIRAGFCGFTFFINGEWTDVTIDTRLPAHQRGEFSLSKSILPKAPYWISLFEKAYAKIFGSYTVLNNTLLKDFLVDFTGGWSKMIRLPKDNIEEKHKKFYFDEITRCVNQGYLMGCMKYDESKIQEELNESISDKDGNEEEEQILHNTIYTIIDIQEYDNLKLIFLVNHWDKGKFTHPYGPEDETWEANKKLTERLNYTVSTTDGTFWMLFDEFITSFNTLYYCRIFPDTWAQYTIPGEWVDESSGGAPQKNKIWKPEQKLNVGPKHSLQKKASSVDFKDKTEVNINSSLKKKSSKQIPPHQSSTDILRAQTMRKDTTNALSSNTNSKDVGLTVQQHNQKEQQAINASSKANIQCDFKRDIITDTEEAFFLNPQYKLAIRPNNKLIISLMQEDKKMENNAYIKCNFIIIYSKGRRSRVWDIKESNIIKKALDDKDDGIRREIVMLLDYNEIIRKYNVQNGKKLPKNETVYVNLIPYMEYSEKYEIERKGNQRTFKPYHPQGRYWLRIFSNDELYIVELKPPYETSVEGTWIQLETSGGPRFLLNKNKYIENPFWPVNPQYMLTFHGNIRTKIILRKKGGHFSNEETNVGLIVTKPNYYDEDKNKLIESKNKAHQRKVKEKVKLNAIQRVIKSTNQILQTKQINYNEIYPKLSMNISEHVLESTYNNNYCASIHKTFSKLDSPLILIPTLASRESGFDYEMKIYSTKPTEIYSLFTDSCATLVGEWNEDNAGGSHLYYEDKESNNDESSQYKKQLTWLDNPKFLIQFDSKDWIKDLHFQIIISRSESIWKRRLSMSMINAMMSCYIFKYDKDKWFNKCVNKEEVDFMSKNSVIIDHHETKGDPKGFILMPITYAKDVYGPFTILVKSAEKFKLTVFKDTTNHNNNSNNTNK